jgi:hypothetical protein
VTKTIATFGLTFKPERDASDSDRGPPGGGWRIYTRFRSGLLEQAKLLLPDSVTYCPALPTILN